MWLPGWRQFAEKFLSPWYEPGPPMYEPAMLTSKPRLDGFAPGVFLAPKCPLPAWMVW